MGSCLQDLTFYVIVHFLQMLHIWLYSQHVFAVELPVGHVGCVSGAVSACQSLLPSPLQPAGCIGITGGSGCQGRGPLEYGVVSPTNVTEHQAVIMRSFLVMTLCPDLINSSPCGWAERETDRQRDRERMWPCPRGGQHGSENM